MYSATKIETIIKSITIREIFKNHPEVKEQLWGGGSWSDEYFVNTVSKFGNENTLTEYVKKQANTGEYKQLCKTEQLMLIPLEI